MPLDPDKADDLEVQLTSMPGKYPPKPSWDVRQINAMTRGGAKPDDPGARAQRRRKAVEPK